MSTKLSIDRIDFVHDARCGKCNRRLNSGIAHILVDTRGNEIPHGKNCATNVAGKPQKTIPNFTRGSTISSDKQNNPDNRANSLPKKESTEIAREYAREMEYIRLRVERLTAFRVTKYQILYEMHARMKAANFSPDQIAKKDLIHLCNIIKKCETQRTELSPQNLQLCYAYDFWLGYGANKITNERGRYYLASLRKWLRTHLYLTQNQISGANQWLRNVNGAHKLDPTIFISTEHQIKTRTAR